MSKPEPAVNQVWRHKNSGTRVVAAVDSVSVTWREGGCRTLDNLASWSCVGIETPHGRVMVGERRCSRAPFSQFYDVIEVRNDREIVAKYADGTVGHVRADAAAQCPIVLRGETEMAWAPATVKDIKQLLGMGHEVRPDIVERLGLKKATRFDPREQGPGIAAMRPRPPPSLPDVVYTWEAWALP